MLCMYIFLGLIKGVMKHETSQQLLYTMLPTLSGNFMLLTRVIKFAITPAPAAQCPAAPHPHSAAKLNSTLPSSHATDTTAHNFRR